MVNSEAPNQRGGSGRYAVTVELRHLHYFVSASEHGSFRKASMMLGIRESTISRAIRDLEDALGASLFQRHAGGICLTFAGTRFLRRTRLALRQISDGIKEVAAVGRCDTGHIKIGMFSSLSSGFLSELLRAFHQDHADVQIDLIHGNPAEHVAAIRRLDIDIAFITGTREWSDCETEVLWSERVFAVLPEKHHLSCMGALRWSDLADEKFIVSEKAPGPEIWDYLIQRLADFGYHPEIHPQQVDRHNILALVAGELGVTLTSEATTATLTPGIAYRPIVDESLPFSAVWSSRNDNPALRRLLSMARTLSKRVS